MQHRESNRFAQGHTIIERIPLVTGYLYILSNKQLSTVDIFCLLSKLIDNITILMNPVIWLPSLWFVAITLKFLVQKKHVQGEVVKKY